MIVLMFMCMILFIRRHTYLFFFNAPSTTDLYTLSLHDALPIYSSAPFRNRSEAFDTAWLSQSLEQAKVPDAVLPGSPPSARPERSERRTHPCGSRNEAT